MRMYVRIATTLLSTLLLGFFGRFLVRILARPTGSLSGTLLRLLTLLLLTLLLFFLFLGYHDCLRLRWNGINNTLGEPARSQCVHHPCWVVALGEVSVEEVDDEGGEAALRDGRSNVASESHHLVYVVDGHEGSAHLLSCHHGVQKSAGIVSAGAAATGAV